MHSNRIFSTAALTLLAFSAFGQTPTPAVTVTSARAAARLLDQATWGPTPSSVAQLQGMPIAQWLTQQFALNTSDLPDQPILDAAGKSNNNLAPVQAAFFQNAVTGQDQLRQRVAFALSRPSELSPCWPGATAKTNNPAYYTGQMFAVNAEHDTTAKTIVANVTIPAGGTAQQDLNALLDALMAQPTMAPFVSQQLIEHLVTSNPSPAYIQRVAQVFQNDGSGVTGNLQAVVTAILTDPEARAADDPSAAVNANFGHLREPILFMTNILRGLNATLTPTNNIQSDATEMGEQLFYAPSVFSYFSPQYRTEKGLLGPEFQIYSTQTVADRADIVNSALYGKLDSTTTLALTPFATQAATSTGNLLAYISSVFLHGGMSTALQQAVTSAVNAATTPTAKAQAALYVVLTSGEYNIVQ